MKNLFFKVNSNKVRFFGIGASLLASLQDAIISGSFPGVALVPRLPRAISFHADGMKRTALSCTRPVVCFGEDWT